MTPVMDVVADVSDIRDQIFQPSLRPLRPRLQPMTEKPGWWSANRIRDQGSEPSCVGHALAAVIDHMRAAALIAQHESAASGTLENPYVSAAMLYNLARFHDEWEGEEYGGSSIRGGLKGFFYNGVCSEELVRKVHEEYLPRKRGDEPSWLMTRELGADARNIQLGAYYRIRPRLPEMHAALNEANALVVSAYMHDGWLSLAKDGRTIAFDPKKARGNSATRPQMHAFAVVGYDEEAFWVQNSWGKAWGQDGLARWLYIDWAANVVDAWVLALAVLPPNILDSRGSSRLTAYGSRIERSETHFLSHLPANFSGPSRLDVLGHMVPFRDGKLDRFGPYNTNRETLQATIDLIAGRYDDAAAAKHGVDCARPGQRIKKNERRYRHVLVYFLGGWPDENRLAMDIAAVAPTFRDLRIYPFFIAWDTPLFQELNRLIRQAIEHGATLSKSPSLARRVARDRRIEGMIALPGNRLLRDLRQSARRMFVQDQPDPDLPAGSVEQGQAAYCLQRLFDDLAPLYRDGEIDFHVAAHGFGAQLALECIAHQDRIARRAAFQSATLISPLVARQRVGHVARRRDDGDRPTLFEMLNGRGDKLSRRRMDCLAIERLRIIGIDPDTLRMDRFSDDYGHSWPDLAAFVMGLDPNAIEAGLTEPCSENELRRGHRRLPLLGAPQEIRTFGAAARDAGLDVEIEMVASREDVVDSSLHHELGFHRRVLDRLAESILRRPLGEVFGGNGRRIAFAPLSIGRDVDRDQ